MSKAVKKSIHADASSSEEDLQALCGGGPASDTDTWRCRLGDEMNTLLRQLADRVRTVAARAHGSLHSRTARDRENAKSQGDAAPDAGAARFS